MKHKIQTPKSKIVIEQLFPDFPPFFQEKQNIIHFQIKINLKNARKKNEIQDKKSSDKKDRP